MQRYTRLTLAEREEISRHVAVGVSVRAMARQLGRVPSTISRELHRATLTPRTYRAAAASQWASAARCTPRRPRKLKDRDGTGFQADHPDQGVGRAYDQDDPEGRLF
jgi:IS30 family transposase